MKNTCMYFLQIDSSQCTGFGAGDFLAEADDADRRAGESESDLLCVEDLVLETTDSEKS